jgi:arylsulfatase A-like enzyme
LSKPNILLIVIDSLRSDKCISKNLSSITPNIDFLIKNGTAFPNTISSAAATAVALSSIFTGLPPFKIGMGTNNYHKFSPDIETYVKILKNNGYKTYATAPSVAEDFGLICDFENSDSTYRNYLSLFDGLGEQIIEKLSNYNLNVPWFFYIHIFDLHAPITVPKSFSDKKFGSSKYEKQISAIDFWIGKIIGKINLQNTLIILTADHGEYVPIVEYNNKIINLEASDNEAKLWKIGNRIPNISPNSALNIKKKIGGLLRNTRTKIKKQKIDELNLSPYQKRVLMESRMEEGHRMFDDLIKVPLIFSGLNVPSNKEILQQVRHVDIFPTIEDIISLPKKQNVDGYSLLPLMQDKLLEEIPAYIESPPSVMKNSKKIIGIRTSNYKMIKQADSNEILELYNIIDDPLEEKNIVKDYPEVVLSLDKKLSKIRNLVVSSNDSNQRDKKIENVLKRLGYV